MRVPGQVKSEEVKSEGAHLDVGVLLLEQLAGARVEGGGDVDEERALEGGAGLVVDGVVAGLGGVQDDAGGVVDVEDRDVAGGARGLDVHRMVVGSAVHCSSFIRASASLVLGRMTASCCSLWVQPGRASMGAQASPKETCWRASPMSHRMFPEKARLYMQAEPYGTRAGGA